MSSDEGRPFTQRRRETDRFQTDHDLLLQIAADVRMLVSEQQAHTARLNILETWRTAQAVVTAVDQRRVEVLERGDSTHDIGITRLEEWRSEMRGAWAGARFGLIFLSALSGLSVILELARIGGVLR